jgi:hypothetical protein
MPMPALTVAAAAPAPPGTRAPCAHRRGEFCISANESLE